MPDRATLVAAAIAALVATLGLWWFQFILKEMRRVAPATRYGVYALIWLAYFVLVMLLALGRGR